MGRRVLATSRFDEDLKELLDHRIVNVAIVPRFIVPAPNPNRVSPALSQFHCYFQIVQQPEYVFRSIGVIRGLKSFSSPQRVRLTLSVNHSERERGHDVRLSDVRQVQADTLSAPQTGSLNHPPNNGLAVAA